MNTLLSVSPRQALPLIESVSAGASVAADYPLVFGPKAPGRVLDHGACAELLQRLIGTAGTAVFASSGQGPGVSLTTPFAQGFLTDDLLLALLFPAFGLNDEVQELRTSFGLEQACFPVSLFAWGLDSI